MDFKKLFPHLHDTYVPEYHIIILVFKWLKIFFYINKLLSKVYNFTGIAICILDHAYYTDIFVRQGEYDGMMKSEIKCQKEKLEMLKRITGGLI